MNGGTVRRRFVEVADRQVQYRTAGDGPPVIVLHDVPGSSTQAAGLIEELAGTRRVYAPDAPGHGLSDACPGRDEMSGFVESTVAFTDTLGLGGYRWSAPESAGCSPSPWPGPIPTGSPSWWTKPSG